jgi:hypothetical protein
MQNNQFSFLLSLGNDRLRLEDFCSKTLDEQREHIFKILFTMRENIPCQRLWPII